LHILRDSTRASITGMWIDLPGNGGWLDGKRGRYKDKKGRCDWCAFQRYILAGVIFTFIIWVKSSSAAYISDKCSSLVSLVNTE
jgi:hypothetical protein